MFWHMMCQGSKILWWRQLWCGLNVKYMEKSHHSYSPNRRISSTKIIVFYDTHFKVVIQNYLRISHGGNFININCSTKTSLQKQFLKLRFYDDSVKTALEWLFYKLVFLLFNIFSLISHFLWASLLSFSPSLWQSDSPILWLFDFVISSSRSHSPLPPPPPPPQVQPQPQ